MLSVKQQIEQIIDEGAGPRRTVIVQMPPNDSRDIGVLDIAADVHRRRSLCHTARALLPVPKSKLDLVASDIAGNSAASRKQRANIRAVLASADASLAVQVGRLRSQYFRADDEGKAEQSFRRLFDSDIVKKSIGESAGKRGSAQLPAKFWAAQTAVLNMSREDLPKLPTEVADIFRVYPNRTLRTPALVEVKDLPDYVDDQKTSSWGVRKIGALAAWGAYGSRGKGIKIGLLDTGVDASHPDLEGKISSWAEFDDQGNPIVGSEPHDSDRHGTHCAGIMVGGNNSGRYIGVAPEAEIAAALVLPKGSGSDAQVLAGIQWAIDQQVDVINMSLGGLTLDWEPPGPYTRMLVTALRQGIPVITAIGNEGNQTTGSPGNDWFALSVGATDYNDRCAGFSGGRTHVIRQSAFLMPETLPLVYMKPEISAPGVAVTSSVPGRKWAAFNGTSMATPHVAGAVALLLSATAIRGSVNDVQRPFLIQDLLTGSVEELGESGQDHRYGFGRLDVLRSIGFAKDLGY